MKPAYFLKTALLLVTLCSLGLPAGADQLFVKNREFEGLAIPAGGKLWVELEPFCQALNVRFQRADSGGYILSNSSRSDVPKYSVATGDGLIRGDQVQGKLLVPLKELASKINARVVHNKKFETIDVTPGR